MPNSPLHSRVLGKSEVDYKMGFDEVGWIWIDKSASRHDFRGAKRAGAMGCPMPVYRS